MIEIHNKELLLFSEEFLSELSTNAKIDTVLADIRREIAKTNQPDKEGLIKMMEDRSLETDTVEYKVCSWFVFNRLYSLGFYSDNKDLCDANNELWQQTEEYLKMLGFHEVDFEEGLENGDVVVYYGRKNGVDELRSLHFGAFYGNSVISKFGNKSVFRHRISIVPNRFGEYVVHGVKFFRHSELNLQFGEKVKNYIEGLE